ncbi:MAG: Gfo/Idh/MocA family oxidoreductase [Scytolyngbya sp. HA4215-MV1]|nr:Gfo/Idh/MocA family oxidoreductase [Scytolyngbya sp. HA4215-MV1]
MRVGLVGTGYAAKVRAEALSADPRAQLVAVAGHSLEKAAMFSQPFQAQAVASWQALVERSDLDLVMICTINRDHGTIAHTALQAGKHVVVEYPLAIEVAQAEALVHLAKMQKKLLHVEHIELLGSVHQTLKQTLPEIGAVFYARYATLTPQHPAPAKWTYQPELFGFPLVGALSRVHRLTDLFGSVKTVSCQARYWQAATAASSHYSTCLCTAQLRFHSGMLAEITYGKGEALWQPSRIFELQGEKGALIFDGDQGTLIQGKEPQLLEISARRGLFAQDTQRVLNHLIDGKPLYLTAEESLYTLKVADAARRSAETGQTIELEPAVVAL